MRVALAVTAKVLASEAATVDVSTTASSTIASVPEGGVTLPLLFF